MEQVASQVYKMLRGHETMRVEMICIKTVKNYRS